MAVNTRSADLMGWCAFLLGIGVVVFAIAVTCHSYIPCPFWDEWVVVADIGSGKGPTHLAWLWSQQNEHRLAIPRLLVWLDLVAFHGRNVSLFIEILGVQVLHWAALCFVVERFTRAPVSVKRSIQGLFGFCLFHPNQLENFTWAFQIGFVLPFALATLALILIAFFSRWRRPVLAVIIAGGMPILAALNLAGGLVIGPVVVGIAWCKRTRAWVGAMLTAIWFASAAGYLYGYHRAGTDLPPCAAILQGRKLFLYVLTYFGASWTRLLPHKERLIAFASILIFAAILGRALRRRRGGRLGFGMVAPRRMRIDDSDCATDCLWANSIWRGAGLCRAISDPCDDLLGCAWVAFAAAGV